MFVSSPFVGPYVNSPYGPSTNRQEVNPAVDKPQPPEVNLPRIVNYLADYSGCGHWRIIWPEQIMNASNMCVSQSNTCMILDPRWYTGVKAVKIQRQATDSQKQFVQFLKQIQQEHGFKLIYEVDDVVFREDIPDYNKFKFAFDNDSIRSNCIDIINMCDEVTVTCDYMRDLYRARTGKKEITVIPNFPPEFWLGHYFNHQKICNDLDKHYKRPRILYTGSGAHYDVDNNTGGKDDFEHVLRAIVDTRHKYRWIFMGAFPPPLRPFIENGDIEFHQWETLYKYPKKIASLDINMMVAPLQDNSFNRAKSDIKFIEACALGLPVACQDMITYKDAQIKFKTGSEMIDLIEKTIKNKHKYRSNSIELRKIGESRFLEKNENIGAYFEALLTPYQSSQRNYLRKWNP